MMDYSQGIAHDGAAILHHGIAMTPDEIVLKLNHYADLEYQLSCLKVERAGQVVCEVDIGVTEKKIRDRLVELGWTPPKEQEGE